MQNEQSLRQHRQVLVLLVSDLVGNRHQISVSSKITYVLVKCGIHTWWQEWEAFLNNRHVWYTVIQPMKNEVYLNNILWRIHLLLDTDSGKKAKKQPILVGSCFINMQQYRSHTHATMKELSEEVFSMRSVQRLYKQGKFCSCNVTLTDSDYGDASVWRRVRIPSP
jgi:hypothetical protein